MQKIMSVLVLVATMFLVGCGSPYEFHASYKGDRPPIMLGGVTLLGNTGNCEQRWSDKAPKRHPDVRSYTRGFDDSEETFSRYSSRTETPMANPFSGRTEWQTQDNGSVNYHRTPGYQYRYYGYGTMMVIPTVPVAPLVDPYARRSQPCPPGQDCFDEGNFIRSTRPAQAYRGN